MRKSNYKQCILTNVKPQDIQIVDGVLILYINIYATLSHGKANYLVRLEAGEYDLNTNLSDFYVYLEVDTLTAKKQLKLTETDVTVFGENFPSSYPTGKLYYNLDNDKSYIKTFSGWVENIRINLCKVSNGVIEKTYTGLSQAYSGTHKHKAGEIQLDENKKPLKVETQDGFRFVTDADTDLLDLQDIKSSSLENVSAESVAVVNIQKHDLLIRTSDYGIIKGTNISENNPIIAIALNDAQVGEECFIKEQGFIRDRSWRWADPPNTKLFCDSNGRLTTVVDWNANSVQEVGYIVDVDTIYFNPNEKISINSLTVQTP